MKERINDLCISSYVKFKTHEGLLKAKLNKKGVNNTLEVAGMVVLAVSVLILVLPQARNAVSSIWKTVTDNAKSFFNDSTQS